MFKVIPLFLAGFGLALIIESTLLQQNTQSSIAQPKIDLTQEFLKKQAIEVSVPKMNKVKIGIIDVGHVNWSELPKVSFSQSILDSHEDQNHGHNVTNEIVQALNSQKVLDQVEIVYCQASSQNNYNIENCVNFMIDQNVNITNISFAFGNGATVSESVGLNKLLKSSKLILSAGNDGLNSGNKLCDISSSNKICVGGYNSIEIDPNSNYGTNVDIYEPYYAQYSNNRGTSFSAPIHASKLAVLLIHGKSYEYSNHKVSNNRQLASVVE